MSITKTSAGRSAWCRSAIFGAVAPHDIEALLGEPPDDQVAEPFVVLDDVHQCGHLRAVSRRGSPGDLTRA